MIECRRIHERMTKVARYFIELMQVALGRIERLSGMPTEKQWYGLLQMSVDHSMQGIIFAGIQRLSQDQMPPLRVKMLFHGQSEAVRLRNATMNEQCVVVTEYFRKAGFRTAIMKGQGNARLYGDLSDARSSGDIDIWVEGGFEKVNAFVQETCPTKEVNELEIQYGAFPGFVVEVHYRPFIMRNFIYNARLQKFFDNEAEACFGQNEPVNWVTMRFNIIHQLAHIRLHLFTEGIGLRQLMDYYFVLMNSKEDRGEMMRIVRSLGMESFASALMWVMSDIFRLDKEKLLCEPNEKNGRFLFDEVVKSGNFGRNDKELKEKKKEAYGHFWLFFIRNIRYWRFDKWDWICGPLWRFYYRFWKLKRGFE